MYISLSMDSMYITQHISIELINSFKFDIFELARQCHCVNIEKDVVRQTYAFTFFKDTLFPYKLGDMTNTRFHGNIVPGHWEYTYYEDPWPMRERSSSPWEARWWQ